MYRVLILLVLAIVGNTFAVDSSDTILQAKSIADTSVTLSWAPIEGARSYKVVYDEEALLTSPGAKPLLDTDFTDKTTLQV